MTEQGLERWFERWARWLLPRCRALETAHGQVFEHLHRGAGAPGAY
eukprot:gene3728-18584_t